MIITLLEKRTKKKNLVILENIIQLIKPHHILKRDFPDLSANSALFISSHVFTYWSCCLRRLITCSRFEEKTVKHDNWRLCIVMIFVELKSIFFELKATWTRRRRGESWALTADWECSRRESACVCWSAVSTIFVKNDTWLCFCF